MGCRKVAGVPVDVIVAAILRATSPDLPTPDTMTRPLEPAINRTARTNELSSDWCISDNASRSSSSTRRPRATITLSVPGPSGMVPALVMMPLPLVRGYS